MHYLPLEVQINPNRVALGLGLFSLEPPFTVRIGCCDFGTKCRRSAKTCGSPNRELS